MKSRDRQPRGAGRGSSAVAFDTLRALRGARRAARGALTREDVRLVATSAGVMRIRDSGTDGDLPAVVLACDPPNVVEHYDTLVEMLAGSYRVVCCEMPGFGFSRPARGFGFTLVEYERVTEQLLDDLHVTQAVLGFPCVWGYVALRLAVRRPDLVRGLVLAQAPHWSEEIAWARRLDPNRLIGRPYVGQLLMAVSAERVARGWYRAALPSTASATTTAGFTGPAVRALRAGGLFCLASLTQAWFGRVTTELMHHLTPATQPAVLLWGRADRTHRRSDPESVRPYLADGQVLTYPDAGHFPELERPERLLEALTLIDRA